MKLITGHECKCGKQAHYAFWGVINDPEIGEKAECGWIWECIDCHYDREEGNWRVQTCGECARFADDIDVANYPVYAAHWCYMQSNHRACPDFVPRATPTDDPVDVTGKPEPEDTDA